MKARHLSISQGPAKAADYDLVAAPIFMKETLLQYRVGVRI